MPTIAQRLLAILDHARRPVSTPDLVALVGERRQSVSKALYDLERGGLVMRERHKHKPRPKRGTCAACKCPDRVMKARGLCCSCYVRRPETRRDCPEPNCGHTKTTWRTA